jgi:type II secretory pathway pseudopilin PulG
MHAVVAMPRSGGGATLVEVMAGLVLLATLLGVILEAKARHTHQLAEAQRRTAAVVVADRLLTTWWLEPAKFPHSGQGKVEGAGQMTWRTKVVQNAVVARWGLEVVRLEVNEDRADRASDTLASVEVMLSKAPDPQDAGAETNVQR